MTEPNEEGFGHEHREYWPETPTGPVSADLKALEWYPPCSLTHADPERPCGNQAAATARFPHSGHCRYEQILEYAFVCNDCITSHLIFANRIPRPCPMCGMPLHKRDEWITDINYLPAVQ